VDLAATVAAGRHRAVAIDLLRDIAALIAGGYRRLLSSS
jgi:hypothetical protein